MKVSFGTLINKKHIHERTFKQEATQDVINNIFEAQIYSGRALARILEKKLGVDVVVTSLKDGSTLIDFEKTKNKSAKIYNKNFVENNFPSLKINNNNHLLNICKVIENYADTCFEKVDKL